MQFNLLTLPILALVLFFILLVTGGIQFSDKPILTELFEAPIYYLVSSISIIYLLITSLNSSELIEEYPITSYVVFPLSLILLVADYLLVYTLIDANKDAYTDIYISMLIIGIFWVPLGLGLFNLIDKIVKFIRND